MTKINCPNCGAVGYEGSVCDFCGTTIVGIAKKEVIKSTKKPKTATDYEIISYLGKITSEASALTTAKSAALSFLRRCAQKKYFQDYWKYINPIEENFNLFTFNVVAVYQIPFYLFQFRAQIDNSIKTLHYIGYAGTSSSFPIAKYLYFTPLKNFNNYVRDTRPNIKALSPSKFVKGKNKVWDSAYAKREREKFRFVDEPEIKHIFLPFYVISVSIPLPLEGDKTDKYEIIVDYSGKIYETTSQSPFPISYINMLARHFLGEKYRDSISNKKNERAAEKIEREKGEQEDKTKEREKERVREKVEVKKDRLENIIAYLIFGIICGAILALVLYVAS